MVKATELRIGNLVTYHGEEDMICTVDAKDIFNIATGYMENHKIHSVIPITEKLLLEFGFEEKNYDYTISISECELVKLMLIPHDEFPSESSVCVIQSNEDDNEEETVFLSDIKYVHQLQNLYFALTGKELIKINNN